MHYIDHAIHNFFSTKRWLIWCVVIMYKFTKLTLNTPPLATINLTFYHAFGHINITYGSLEALFNHYYKNVGGIH